MTRTAEGIRTAERIAVLSDVHGVLPLLDAVLGEPDVLSSELIVVTGDHAAGPQPVAVLDRLRGLGERAVLIRGNADRELAALARDGRAADAPAIDRWAADQLNASHTEFLAALPSSVVVDVSGLGGVLFCHATPRDDAEIVLVDTPLQRWREVLAEVPPSIRVVVCGHTHMPFVRLVDGRRVVNSGSIGMPYGSPLAPWALIDSAGISLCSAPVDRAAVAAQVMADSEFPGVQGWVDEYLLHPPSDGDALAAFGAPSGH